MMSDQEVLKAQHLAEAARQRLNIALTRESPMVRQDHMLEADALLAQLQKVLRAQT